MVAALLHQVSAVLQVCLGETEQTTEYTEYTEKNEDQAAFPWPVSAAQENGFAFDDFVVLVKGKTESWVAKS